MTEIGWVFLVLTAVGVVRPGFLPWVLALTVPFPHTAMWYLGGSGVSPFFTVAMVVAVRLVVSSMNESAQRRGQGDRRPPPTWAVALAVFAVYGLVMTGVGPILFDGVPVFTPRGGIDDQIGNETPLTYSISNAAQAIYLVLGICVAVFLARERGPGMRVFELSIAVGLVLALISHLAPAAWPDALVDNMPNIRYDVFGHRMRGTFAEPSVFAVFLSASIAYLVSRVAGSRGWLRAAYVAAIVLAVVEYALSVSGTALFSLSLLGAFALVIGVRRSMVRRFAGLELVLPVALFGLAAAIHLRETIAAATIGVLQEKVGSGSQISRTAGDLHALRVFTDSWGLGVGLGSNRPSSMLTMLLSCVGVVGTVAFVVFAVSLLRAVLRETTRTSAAWALLGVFFAQVAAKPDLAMPIMWLLVGLCAHAAIRARAQEPAEVVPVIPGGAVLDRRPPVAAHGVTPPPGPGGTRLRLANPGLGVPGAARPAAPVEQGVPGHRQHLGPEVLRPEHACGGQ